MRSYFYEDNQKRGRVGRLKLRYSLSKEIKNDYN